MKKQFSFKQAFTQRSILTLGCVAAMTFTDSATHAQQHNNLSPGEQIAAGVILGVAQAIQQSQAQQSRNNGWQSNQGGIKSAPSYAPNSSGRWNNQGYSRPEYYNNQPQYYNNQPQYYNNQPQPRYPSNNYYVQPQSTYSPGYTSNGQYYTFPDGTVGRIVEPKPSTNSSTYSSTPAVTSATSSSPPKISSIQASKPAMIKAPMSETAAFQYQIVNKKSGKSYDYTMKPGEEQFIKDPEIWKIRFKETNSASWTTYDLRGGTNYQAMRADQVSWNVYEE